MMTTPMERLATSGGGRPRDPRDPYRDPCTLLTPASRLGLFKPHAGGHAGSRTIEAHGVL